MDYSKLVDSFKEFITELLSMFTENPNCLEIMSKLSKKRVELISCHKMIVDSNSEYNKGIKALNFQMDQCKDFIENDFGHYTDTNINPYKALKEYYEIIIDELKSKVGTENLNDDSRNIKRLLTEKTDIKTLKDSTLLQEWNKINEVNISVVSYIINYRKRKMKNLNYL